MVKPYTYVQSQGHGTSRREKSHGFRQREATAGCRAAFSQVRYLVSELMERLFMIKICVILNEGQGQYN